jgi:Txe/YoeB family toxin of toxin-antitoxin system
MWLIKYEKRVQKDLDKLKQANLLQNARKLIKLLETDPFVPPFEKLTGDLNGLFSRRINLKHRMLYKILKKEQIVMVVSMWSHYEN